MGDNPMAASFGVCDNGNLGLTGVASGIMAASDMEVGLEEDDDALEAVGSRSARRAFRRRLRR
jgi:hypothetical protein